MNAPRRLLDDPSVSDALRDDLRVAAEAEPDYDAERGLRALQAAIVLLPAAPLAQGAGQTAASTAPAAGTTAASSASGTLAASSAKLTLAALLAAGLGTIGTATWMNREPSAPANPPARAASAVPAVPAAAPATEVNAVPPAQVPAVEAEPMRVEPAATPQAPPHARSQPPARGAASAAVDPDLALRDEIEHLARVKALLEAEPRAAYELAQAGNRTLSSMFREERDGLSVLALDAAGEHARARALAKRFLRRHPSSPLGERIAAIAAQGAETK